TLESSAPASAEVVSTRKASADLMARRGLFIIVALKNLQRVGALLVIIAATFLVYWPASRNGFVWDDTALVLRDPLIRSWRLIPESFRHFLFLDATASNFYRPLQRLTFLAGYAVLKFVTRGYYRTSVYVHIAAAIACFLFFERLLLSREALLGDGSRVSGR